MHSNKIVKSEIEKELASLKTGAAVEQDAWMKTVFIDASKKFDVPAEYIEDAFNAVFKITRALLKLPSLPEIYLDKFIKFVPNPKKIHIRFYKLACLVRDGRVRSDKAEEMWSELRPALNRIIKQNKIGRYEPFRVTLGSEDTLQRTFAGEFQKVAQRQGKSKNTSRRRASDDGS